MKKTSISVKLGRKKSKPVNVAAKSLSQGQFRPKVEKNPKAYTRKGRGKVPPVVRTPDEGEQ